MSAIKTLKDLRVGDEVVVTGAREARREPVSKIGRKYLTAGRAEYDLETGNYRGKQVGSGSRAYTVERWERREQERTCRREARDFAAHVEQIRSLDRLSNEELAVWRDRLRILREMTAPAPEES